MPAVSRCCVSDSLFFPVLLCPLFIMLVNGLNKADMTPYLIYTDFEAQIRPSVVYLFALG